MLWIAAVQGLCPYGCVESQENMNQLWLMQHQPPELCAQMELKMLVFIKDEVNQYSVMLFRCGGCILVSCCH